MPQGSPHTVALDRTQVRVNAHDDADVRVTLNVPAATAGNSDDFRDVAGLIVFTPASASDNGGIALRVPYYLVPRVSTNVEAKLDKPVKASNPSGVINLTNKGSAIAATADFYSWGLDGKGNGSGKKNPIINLASAGVQSFPIGPTDQLIVFAVNTEEAWSSPSTREFDVAIDLNGDGIPDYYVVAIDLGLITDGLLQRTDGHGGLRQCLHSAVHRVLRLCAVRQQHDPVCPSSQRISGSLPPARGSATR